MPDQVKLAPSSMQDALKCPRCFVVAHRHGIKPENFMPWVGTFATWEEKHFVGLNIADELQAIPSDIYFFESIRRFKGLESPYIIALDLPERRANVHRYVAGTRATVGLHILDIK